MKFGTKIGIFLIFFVVVVISYFATLTMDGIWRILVFGMSVFLLSAVAIWFIEKRYPNSKTGKRVVSILKKIRNIAKEFVP